MLALPGLLRVASLIAQLSHSGPQHHFLVPWCSSKSRGLDVLAEVPLPAVCDPHWESLGTPLSAILPSHPSHLAARDTAQHRKTPGHLISLSRQVPRRGAMGTGGRAWPSLPACRNVSALPRPCSSGSSGRSLGCRGHLGRRGGSVPGCGSGLPQGRDPAEPGQLRASSTAVGPGLQALGSSGSFQTCAVPETNLPANLLLTVIKSNTESGSGNPKPNPILKALLSPWPGALRSCSCIVLVCLLPSTVAEPVHPPNSRSRA